ncbi:unnamed protein product [Rhizopus stolonifer]
MDAIGLTDHMPSFNHVSCLELPLSYLELPLSCLELPLSCLELPLSCLELPLSCIYRLDSFSPESSRPSITTMSVHSPHIHKSWNHVFVHQAYILDTFHNRIRRRRRNELHSYPRIINRFFKALNNHQILLLDFFLLRCLTNPDCHIITDTGRVDFSWWAQALKPSWLISTDTTTFRFRQHLLPNPSLPTFSYAITGTQ